MAKVAAPRSPEEWEVLRYELSSFVCEGEYERGLERVLSSYLANLDKLKQKPPAKASLALEWKPPKRAVEVIPPRDLLPVSLPATFALTTSFPPDDR